MVTAVKTSLTLCRFYFPFEILIPLTTPSSSLTLTGLQTWSALALQLCVCLAEWDGQVQAERVEAAEQLLVSWSGWCALFAAQVDPVEQLTVSWTAWCALFAAQVDPVGQLAVSWTG